MKFMNKRELTRDLRTMVLAAVVSALVVATPSVAAKVANADKVDGKHAVSAGASKSARSGKLVATNKQGFLPDNIIKKAPDADRLDGLDSSQLVRAAARPGEIQTGPIGAWGGGDGSFVEDTQSFPSRLPVAIPPSRITIIATGGPYTATCPGPGQVTVNGWLCIYQQNTGGNVLGLNVYSPETALFGTSEEAFGTYGSCGAAGCWYYGSFAVRAGSADDMGPPARHGAPKGDVPPVR